MLVWIVTLALATLTLYIYLSPPDVDPYFTRHQASFSSTRQPGESATVRSTVNPHGAPLVASGLDFCLADLWKENWDIWYAEGPVTSTSRIKVDELVAEYMPSLRALGANGSKIITTIRDGPTALALLFGCTLQGLTLYFALPSDIEEAVKVHHPGAVIVDSYSNINGIDLGEAIPVSVDPKSKDVMPLVSFKQTSSPPPSPRPTKTAFGVFRDGKTQTFTHKAIGQSIASQLASLDKSDRWASPDRLLNFSLYPTVYSLLMTFVAISCRSRVFYMDHSFTDPFSVVSTVKPTILATDDLSLRSLIRSTDDYRLIGWLQLQFRYLLQQKGRIFSGILGALSSVRIVYTAAVLNERHGALRPDEVRAARALVGCQIVHVLSDPLPITQTTFGDYRITPGKLNFGPPLPGLEIKLSLLGDKYGTLEYSSAPPVFNPSVEGFLLNDGCFYLKQPEPDKIDVYSEHINHA